jgi:endo-1,4-beta-xylanase
MHGAVFPLGARNIASWLTLCFVMAFGCETSTNTNNQAGSGGWLPTGGNNASGAGGAYTSMGGSGAAGGGGISNNGSGGEWTADASGSGGSSAGSGGFGVVDAAFDAGSIDAGSALIDAGIGDGATSINDSASTAGDSASTAGTGGSGGSAPGEHHKFVGNITTNGRVDPSGLRFATYWDQITPENAGKWGSVQSTPNSNFNWGTLDAIYDYAEDNGIIFKQHTFVWGSQQPNGTPTEQQVINWIRSFCERYPNTALIDVVNEPPPHTTPNYANNIGGGTNGNWQWIINSFQWTRQYCPGAILIFNDYNIIEWPNDNQHFINIVNTVLANGGPIDAIGAQAHDLDHGSVTPQRVSELLNKLHDDTGLPVYITEMDLSYADDQSQLSAYQQYFPMFMDADFVPGITIWGWIYGATWSKSPDSGLVRGTSPRLAMTWLMNQLGRPVP